MRWAPGDREWAKPSTTPLAHGCSSTAATSWRPVTRWWNCTIATAVAWMPRPRYAKTSFVIADDPVEPVDRIMAELR